MDFTSIKKTLISMILILTLAVTVACGNSTSNNHQHNNSPLDPQGNWSFSMECGANTTCTSTPSFTGRLYELNPPTVTSSTLLAFSNGCGNFMVKVMGEASGTNSISLTVTQFEPPFGRNPAIFSFEGTIAADQQSMSGTWTSTDTGGCASDTNGTWSASVIPPVTGTWTGTAPNGMGITANLTENTDQTSGESMGSLSGTITLTNTACFDLSAPLTLAAGQSFHSGFTVMLSSAPDANGVILNGGASNTSNYSWTIKGGICDGQTFNAALTQQ